MASRAWDTSGLAATHSCMSYLSCHVVVGLPQGKHWPSMFLSFPPKQYCFISFVSLSYVGPVLILAESACTLADVSLLLTLLQRPELCNLPQDCCRHEQFLGVDVSTMLAFSSRRGSAGEPPVCLTHIMLFICTSLLYLAGNINMRGVDLRSQLLL